MWQWRTVLWLTVVLTLLVCGFIAEQPTKYITVKVNTIFVVLYPTALHRHLPATIYQLYIWSPYDSSEEYVVCVLEVVWHWDLFKQLSVCLHPFHWGPLHSCTHTQKHTHTVSHTVYMHTDSCALFGSQEREFTQHSHRDARVDSRHLIVWHFNFTPQLRLPESRSSSSPRLLSLLSRPKSLPPILCLSSRATPEPSIIAFW